MDDNEPFASDQTVRRSPAAEEQAASVPIDPEIRKADSSLEEAATVIRRESDLKPAPERTGSTPAEVARVLVGQQLNQYQLDELIGGGGMGAVFRAHDQQLDRVVAVKVIPFVGNDPELQRRFRNEAQNAAKLDHPRIARVFDAGSHDDWHYIVFEYIQGTNLRDLVQNEGVLSLDDAVYYTTQVAEALDHAAQRGIVHRDIKPSNVLIADDGTVKLVDMGLARSDSLDLSEDLTASGVTLGTFDYISPEQALDPRDADLRSDLYSLGCTLYYMVTGEPPYTGGTMLQKLLSHGNAPPPDPRQLRPALPDEVVAVMHRMMAKDPKARYQNASDLLADLNELAFRFQLKRAKAISGFAPPVVSEGLQRLQFHLPWVIAASLVLLVAGYLELQSIPSRDAFVIPTPPVSFNSPDVDPNNQVAPPAQDTDRETFAPDPQTDPLGAPSESEMQTGNAEALSDAAARPPSLADTIPLPSSPTRTDDTEASLTERVSETVGVESETSLAMNSDSETEASSDPSEAESVPGLPTPAVVRVVPPNQLALALRVDQVDRHEDGSILASNLEDAIDLAMRFGVLRLEFATDEIVTGPISLPFDNMEFVSTVGRTTIRMVAEETLTFGRSDMLTIGNRRASFSDLDFQWELADDQVDGGSMFVIHDNRLVQFRGCSFTLVNKAIHDGVTFFRVITDPEELPDSETLPGRMFNPNPNAMPLVAIQLENAVVRGEANFIEMDYAVALQLVWNNGLLAISGRMIETNGARVRPSIVTSPIQISLTNLTAEMLQGLLRMNMENDGVFAVPIQRDARQCVFVVGEGQPHVEIIGSQAVNDQADLLRITGEANAYVVAPDLSNPMLVVTDLEGNTEVNLMSDLLSEALPWADERRPRWTVYWSNRASQTQTYHLLRPSDYRQDGAVFGGFEEVDLPPMP